VDVGKYLGRSIAAFIAMSAVPGLTAASDGSLLSSFRIGAALGHYDGNLDIDVSGSASGRQSENESSNIFGAFLGANLVGTKFYGDLGVEFLDVDDFDLTEIIGSGGIFLNPHWNIFIGYRLATQGDGVMDDEFYQEKGPVAGITFSKRVFESNTFSMTAAYNRSKFDFSDAKDDTADGFVAKVQYGWIRKQHHAVGIRVRAFYFDSESEDDNPNSDIPIRTSRSLEETYTTVYYQITFQP
jgi:hypothetical protein